MTGSVCTQHSIWKRLCGEKGPQRLRFVTTMWDVTRDKSRAGSRVSELEGNFWKPLINEGARHRRFENTPNSAWDIIRNVTGDSEILPLPRDWEKVERKLNETDEGRALHSRFRNLLQAQVEINKNISDETKMEQDPALARELNEEYKRIEDQLQRTWAEMEKMKIPFLTQIRLFFSELLRL